MSFSCADATRLSEQLPALDVSLSEAAANLPLLADWRAFYQVDFVGEGLCHQHHCGYFDAAGFRLVAHIWTQPGTARGSVFFLHGYTDHTGLMRHALRHLLQQGWNLVTFDLPGHGLSSGERCSIDSFDHYREVLEACLNLCAQAGERLQQPWHGIGQSTGGAVWLNYLCHLHLHQRQPPQQPGIERIALLAPLVRPAQWGWLQHAFPLLHRVCQDIPRGFTANSHDEDFLHFVREQDPLQYRRTPLRWVAAMHQWSLQFPQQPSQSRPLLIVQGDADGTVDFRYNLPCIAAVFPGCSLHTISGARHQLVNESPPYREQVFRALDEWLQEE